MAKLAYSFVAAFLVASSSFTQAAPRTSLTDTIQATRGSDLSVLLKTWENSQDQNLPKNLLKIALDATKSERTRAIAFKGVASLHRSGRIQIPEKVRAKLERDRSWVIRLALLQWLSETNAPELEISLSKALKDPALVIRSEATRLLARRPTLRR